MAALSESDKLFIMDTITLFESVRLAVSKIDAEAKDLATKQRVVLWNEGSC